MSIIDQIGRYAMQLLFQCSRSTCSISSGFMRPGFGTYIEENEGEAGVYGLARPIRSYNPFRVELDQWGSLMRDLRAARSVREAIGYLLRPPGWRPDGAGDTTEEMRARAGIKMQTGTSKIQTLAANA